MNAFEKHGINHLSASRLNKWIMQPALCLLELAGVSDKAGPAAWRGTAVDKAVTKSAFERDLDIESITDYALDVYEREFEQAETPPREDKFLSERKAIPQYINSGVNWIRAMPEPVSAQGKVIVNIDGISVPLVGYYDLLTEGEVRDIKTCAYAPKSVSEAHGRQLAVYWKATGRTPWVDYVTKKEVKSYEVENVEYYARQLMLTAQSLERVLSFSDDIFECCQLVYPDTDHWMWSDFTKSVAKDVWNMEGLTGVEKK